MTPPPSRSRRSTSSPGSDAAAEEAGKTSTDASVGDEGDAGASPDPSPPTPDPTPEPAAPSPEPTPDGQPGSDADGPVAEDNIAQLSDESSKLTVDQLVDDYAREFGDVPDFVVRGVLTADERDEFTLDEAKETVEDFASHEVVLESDA